jgi:hypothetical protein
MSTFSWKNIKRQADDASKPVPKDWYDLQVSKADVKQASTGALMISARLTIVSGPYANRVLFTNFVLSLDNPTALAIFFRNLAAFGMDDSFFETLSGAESDDPSVGLQAIANSLVDRMARGEVSTRTYQGTERNEITQFARAQGTGAPTFGGGGGFSQSASGAPGIPSLPATTTPPMASPSIPSVPDSAPAPATVAPPAPPVF